MLSDVLSCLQSILEGIRQSGILLSFYNNPALVTGILDDLEDGLEVNIAIAGNCECALADAFKEAPLVCTSLSYDAAAKVLEVISISLATLPSLLRPVVRVSHSSSFMTYLPSRMG